MKQENDAYFKNQMQYSSFASFPVTILLLFSSSSFFLHQRKEDTHEVAQAIVAITVVFLIHMKLKNVIGITITITISLIS